MLSIVNDNMVFADDLINISIDMRLYLFGFLTLFLLNCFIILELYKIKEYIKRRGDK